MAEKHFGAMETYSADSDDVSVGGATKLTASWMEQASSIHLSCAQPSLGTCSCRMTTRHATLHDVLDRSVAESAGFCTSETWLEGYSEEDKMDRPIDSEYFSHW